MGRGQDPQAARTSQVVAVGWPRSATLRHPLRRRPRRWFSRCRRRTG